MEKKIKFLCNKLGRDKGAEMFKTEGITPRYRTISGQELREALKCKLMEEAHEVCESNSAQELTAELADVLEVVDALCKAYALNREDVEQVKQKKYRERGGFEEGFYLESLKMDEGHPRVKHFRADPKKYPEVKK